MPWAQYSCGETIMKLTPVNIIVLVLLIGLAIFVLLVGLGMVETQEVKVKLPQEIMETVLAEPSTMMKIGVKVFDGVDKLFAEQVLSQYGTIRGWSADKTMFEVDVYGRDVLKIAYLPFVEYIQRLSFHMPPDLGGPPPEKGIGVEGCQDGRILTIKNIGLTTIPAGETFDVYDRTYGTYTGVTVTIDIDLSPNVQTRFMTSSLLTQGSIYSLEKEGYPSYAHFACLTTPSPSL